MPAVSFVISNSRHHPAMFAPVIAYLLEDRRIAPRVISLCEVRGQTSPTGKFAALGVPLERVLPWSFRKGPLERTVEVSKSRSRSHRRIQDAFWFLFLGPRLAGLLAPPPALIVLPNDSAFPYERIAALLANRGIPYLLVQEGIRFPLPGVPRDRAYGRGGAAAIATWGESSASYFRDVGVEAGRIHLTGNPRFDQIAPRDARLEGGNAGRARNLLLVTNPIDEQGFCTKGEKLQLARRFIDGIESLIESGEVNLTLKLHASESPRDYTAIFETSPVSSRVVITEINDLYSLLKDSDAVVIMASTVGLEAMLFGLPVGVLELPGAGFVFDYVASQAALGLVWSKPMATQIRELLIYDSPGVASFLGRHLSTSNRATEKVAELIARLSASKVASTEDS